MNCVPCSIFLLVRLQHELCTMFHLSTGQAATQVKQQHVHGRSCRLLDQQDLERKVWTLKKIFEHHRSKYGVGWPEGQHLPFSQSMERPEGQHLPFSQPMERPEGQHLPFSQPMERPEGQHLPFSQPMERPEGQHLPSVVFAVGTGVCALLHSHWGTVCQELM